MIHTIFPHYFYSLISPPNKKELIRSLNNVSASSLNTPEWANECKIKVESLDPQSVGPILQDTLFTYFNELGINFGPQVKLLSVWKNTYNKGYYQEIHNHHTTEGCHLSGVVFFNDWVEGASKFYFYNKFFAELPTSWLKIVDQNKLTSQSFTINPKAGDIILFPSYMLHGVTMHKINQKRTTVAFNISL